MIPLKKYLVLCVAIMFVAHICKGQDTDSVTNSLVKKLMEDSNINLDSIVRQWTQEPEENGLSIIMQRAEKNIEAYNCEEAIRDNEEIMQIMPSTALNCLMHIARFKKYMGDFDGAIAAYKQILELDSKEQLTHNNMAGAYYSAGKYQDAINVLDANPNEERMPTENYLYAASYFKLHQVNKAKKYIEKYLKTEFANAFYPGYKIAAEIYALSGGRKKSCAYITKAIEIIAQEEAKTPISKVPEKQMQYFFMQETLRNIAETKKLKVQYCK